MRFRVLPAEVDSFYTICLCCVGLFCFLKMITRPSDYSCLSGGRLQVWPSNFDLWSHVKVEGENQFHKVLLWPPYILVSLVITVILFLKRKLLQMMPRTPKDTYRNYQRINMSAIGSF